MIVESNNSCNFTPAKFCSGLTAQFLEGIFCAPYNTTVVFLRSRQREALSKDLANGRCHRSLFGTTLKTCLL